MSDTDINKEIYNKFYELPNLSYNVASYLMENNEFIWKLLKYSEADAWDRPSLTKTEKRDLIYDGVKEETSCRVFFDLGQDDSWTVQATILRIAVLSVRPVNHIKAITTIGVEIFTHYKISTLSNYQMRNVAIAQSLLESLNGQEVGGGLGRLFFDSRASATCKLVTIGQIPYKGIGLNFSNYMV